MLCGIFGLVAETPERIHLLKVFGFKGSTFYSATPGSGTFAESTTGAGEVIGK